MYKKCNLKHHYVLKKEIKEGCGFFYYFGKLLKRTEAENL